MIERTPSSTSPEVEQSVPVPVPAAGVPQFWSDLLAERGLSTATAAFEARTPPNALAKWFRQRIASYSLVLSATTQPAGAVWVLGNTAHLMEAMTAQYEEREEIERVVDSLVQDANAVFLEDGMTGWLGERVEFLIGQYGAAAMAILRDELLAGRLEDKTASHVLRWIGRSHDRRTFADRLHLIETALDSPLPVVRDGAALALGELDSPRAISSLRAAIEREQRQGLRADMRAVLERLERCR